MFSSPWLFQYIFQDSSVTVTEKRSTNVNISASRYHFHQITKQEKCNSFWLSI